MNKWKPSCQICGKPKWSFLAFNTICLMSFWRVNASIILLFSSPCPGMWLCLPFLLLFLQAKELSSSRNFCLQMTAFFLWPIYKTTGTLPKNTSKEMFLLHILHVWLFLSTSEVEGILPPKVFLYSGVMIWFLAVPENRRSSGSGSRKQSLIQKLVSVSPHKRLA